MVLFGEAMGEEIPYVTRYQKCVLEGRHHRAALASGEQRDVAHNWFTEGFDTPDLQEAQALLGELS
jgi:hypothetical protein